MLLPGSTSQALAADLAAALDEPLADVEYRRFPDGELLAAAPGFGGERAVVVAATTSSDAHVELLQLQDAAREAGADEVVTVLPYMGYARQERPVAPGKSAAETPPGYPVSARAVARAVSTGADRVLTVSPHEELVCDFFDTPAEAVEAAPRLAAPLPDLDDPVFLAPDAGACDLARTVRDAYGRGAVDHFEKTRLSGSEVEIAPREVDVAGRDVVVADDIVATGSTMSQAIAALEGPARVFVAAVHGLFAGSARTRLERAGATEVYATDTVESAATAVSVAPLLADAL